MYDYDQLAPSLPQLFPSQVRDRFPNPAQLVVLSQASIQLEPPASSNSG